jgi:hypothetical protein
MKFRASFLTVTLAAGLFGFGDAAMAQHQHEHPPAQTDARVLVKFPDELRIHTMANMRDHLLALTQIHDALAKDRLDEAARIAEERLGMSSLDTHGAHEVAKYMPQGMQDAGTAMHHGASQFAIAVQESAATGDLKPALAALARTTQACVACHAGYRLQ